MRPGLPVAFVVVLVGGISFQSVVTFFAFNNSIDSWCKCSKNQESAPFSSFFSLYHSRRAISRRVLVCKNDQRDYIVQEGERVFFSSRRKAKEGNEEKRVR
jgi:hypothetical protein